VSPGLGLAVFFAFFAAGVWALARPRSRAARATLAAVFLVCFAWTGLTGRIAWPFFGWHLYAHGGRTEARFYEVRVADAAGREIKLDARAAPPTMATPLNRIGMRMARLPDAQAVPVAGFLLERARRYRERVASGDAGRPPWKFPPHQTGFRWSPERLAELGPFAELRIYRVDARFSPDGTRLEDREDRLLVRFRASSEGTDGAGAGRARADASGASDA